jgi:hypothetical protein
MRRHPLEHEPVSYHEQAVMLLLFLLIAVITGVGLWQLVELDF